MKTKLFKILIAVTMPFFCFSQTDIKDIDKSVQGIKDNMPTLKKVEKINSKDGTRLAFLKHKELKLVTIKAFEPTAEKNVEWYFVDGHLAYCETNWFDIKTKNNIFTEKCYLNNGHLISWTNSKEKSIDPSSDQFKKMNIDLVAYGTKIKEDALK